MGGTNFKDLTGQYFGRLKVLERAEDYVDKKGKHYVQWICECQCQEKNIVIIKRGNLTRHITQSCGCLQRELVSKRFSGELNTYDLSGEYGIGYASNTGTEFYFDLEDYDKIKDYRWFEHIVMKKYRRIEAYSKMDKDNSLSRTVALHYIITGKMQDHINRNPLDNRKENLRPCNHCENSRNRKRPSNNISGVTGVSYNKLKKYWVTRININKKETVIYIGKDFEEAVKVRLQAEKDYYGEFAPQIHLWEQYGIVNDIVISSLA